MAFLPPFSRTECTCTECVACCKTTPAHLVPGDLFAIADALVKDGRIAARAGVFAFLRASKGAVVGDTATGQLYRIGTITPKMADGRCVFLTSDDRCSIHAVAPFGCAYFSAHDGAMDVIEANYRSMWGLKQITATPGYEALRQQLIKDAGEAEPF